MFALQAAPGTSLIEKTMEINVRATAGECKQSTYGAAAGTSSQVTVNGIDFLKEHGSGVAAGNIYDWTSYSTAKDGNCITLTFVLHSSSSGVYPTEPAPFDRAAESAVFADILNTLQFER